MYLSDSCFARFFSMLIVIMSQAAPPLPLTPGSQLLLIIIHKSDKVAFEPRLLPENVYSWLLFISILSFVSWLYFTYCIHRKLHTNSAVHFSFIIILRMMQTTKSFPCKTSAYPRGYVNTIYFGASRRGRIYRFACFLSSSPWFFCLPIHTNGIFHPVSTSDK